MTQKILLVGESNPYGADPQYALFPSPERSAGYRLCTLVMGLQRAEYLRTFDRVNLCVGHWSIVKARAAAEPFLGRTAILCGQKVSHAFGLDFKPWTWGLLATTGGRHVIIPHPSGLCRLWNEPNAFARARAVILEAIPELAEVIKP